MSGGDEEWVKAAMTDDAMVVELLVHLHGASLRPPAPPLEWSVRQRRSSNSNPKKQASPTTPLSWSGATSLSGDEGSSRPATHKMLSAARSKVNGDSEKKVLKRTRKKKTLAELKDEEGSLLKERRVLKRELVALRSSLEKQRATNDNLKRVKIELQSGPDKETTSAVEESISDHLAIANPIVSDNIIPLQPSTSNCCPKLNPVAAFSSTFVVPDLNMPFEEDHP